MQTKQNKIMSVCEYVCLCVRLYACRFEVFIMAVIAINCLGMAMSFHGESELYRDVTGGFNDACSAIFVLEMLLKISGMVSYVMVLGWSGGWLWW